MIRVAASFLIALLLVAAGVTSAAHSPAHAGGHGAAMDAPADHVPPEAAAAADCCEAPGGQAGGACAADAMAQAAAPWIRPGRAARALGPGAGARGAGLTPAVPPGPPRA
ncbi:MAG: hypothetical protein ACU0BS_12545 [Hasllibacter sp.]